MNRQRFFIIDAFAHIFRAYYAIRNIDNNAIFGFVSMLRKLLEQENPEYIAIAFDSPGPTFRKELYPEYKANRSAAPEDLLEQIPLLKEIIDAYRIPRLEMDGYEADDVIGTLAFQATQAGLQSVIASSDKDMLQLVKGDDVVFYDDRKGVHYLNEEGVPDFFGCRAEQIIDLLSIWGDSSDNIPGVPGVGEKGAKKLLAKYGTTDNIYAHLEEITNKRYRKGFEEAKDNIALMRKLVTICTDLDLNVDWAKFRRQEPDKARLRELFGKLKFNTFLKDVQEPKATVDTTYETVADEKALKAWLADAAEQKFAVFDVETTSLNPLDAELVGVALGLAVGKACYIPLAHKGQEQAWRDKAHGLLKAFFADAQIVKCAHNAKYDYSVLLQNGFEMAGTVEDTMLMAYLINPLENRLSMDYLAETMLNYQTIHFEDVCGQGDEQITFDQVPLDKATQYAAEDADITFQLYEQLSKTLDEKKLRDVYERVERPLIPILSKMERAGIGIDLDHLAQMSKQMESQIEALEKTIYNLAGETFNIKSTKQLGEILFEKLKLPAQGKTAKTKSYSTSQDVLEKLASKGHELPEKLLEYRQLTKLKSTYVDALPNMVHPTTGRVHSHFNQFVTATGRLSSNEPNLQNIPIKTEQGREIRAAFVPTEGWNLLAADYSQVELRLMAHFSSDKTLVEAFVSGEDIHRRTAGEIMGVMPEMVDDGMRRAAKSINFGLIYGMGEFRLAQELGIPRKKAKEYMTTYFEKMPKVPQFRDKLIADAREAGEIRTHFGRLRPLPELSSKNKNLQNQGERLAVNTFIQGTAAEMIKLAMIHLDQLLREAGLEARLLLQVHDELVLECPESETDQTAELLKKAMESVVDFSVPFPAEVVVGNNWKETK